MNLSSERQTSQAIVQYLKATGIKIKRWKASSGEQQERPLPSASGLFGVPLHLLPLSEKEGPIPQFLVDVCRFLSPHLHTEGLFRKSGSMTRIKALKARLESGESCLDSALPCDVAALLKQFFRDLPDPVIPEELREPLYRIQEVAPESERGSATTLVTCLLPRVSVCTLRYLCTFLLRIATRCDENKMDSGNLALVLAPNLFPSSEPSERLTVDTERQLQLQVAVLETLITNAPEIGHIPRFIAERLSSPQDTETACLNPVLQESREHAVRDGSCQRRRRRSMGDIMNGALSRLRTGQTSSSTSQKEPKPAAATDSSPLHGTSFKTKRKASEDSCEGSELKKRKATLDSIGQELSWDDETSGVTSTSLADTTAPTSLSDVFPEAALDASCGQPSTALGVPSTPVPSASIKRQRSKREGRRVQRIPSGRSSCLPPSVGDRTDKVRKSLRLFQRTRSEKEETGESNLETSGWTLMKKMVTEALEGPLFSGKDPRPLQPFMKASEQSHGTPSKTAAEEVPSEIPPSCDEALSTSNPGSPDTETKCGTNSTPCRTQGLQTLDANAGQNLDVQGLCDRTRGLEKDEDSSPSEIRNPSGGNTVPLAGSRLEGAPESPKKQHRVLRKSLSLPENLLESMESTPLETGHKQEMAISAPVDSPEAENVPGVNVCLNGQQVCTSTGMVPRVNSALQLGLPLVLVTLADEGGVETLVSNCLDSSKAARSEQSQEGTQMRIHASSKAQEPLGICVSVVDCIRKLKLSKSTTPKRSVHKISMNFQQTQNTGTEDPPERNPSPLRRRGARKFGRSLSHESGMDTIGASVGGGADATQASLTEQDVKSNSKSPLKSLKTYSRHIFISRKHITLSFAGLRGKKELGTETTSGAFPTPKSAGFLHEILSKESDTQKEPEMVSQETFSQEYPLQHWRESNGVAGVPLP